MSVYFITGIDTDTGKTFATGMAARHLRRQGKNVITQKLAQTGQGAAVSEDIALHRRLMNIELLPEDTQEITCPYCFSFPASPSLAAELAGQRVAPEVITRSTETLLQRFDTVLLEGAGGFLVPLTQELLIADYIAQHNYPVILITSGKLGGINHTLLTVESIRHRNIPLAGIVFNHYPPVDVVLRQEALKVFRRHCSNIVEMPVVDLNNITEVDFSPLFPSQCLTT
jgi:dethiobiotin synthetase